MPPVRLLNRKDWEARLRKLGCKKFDGEGKSGLETGEWWITEHDRLFVVPCEDGLLRADDWQQVQVQIAKLKPLDFDS